MLSTPVRNGVVRGRYVAIIVVVVAIGGAAYVLENSASARPNILSNGGFETGNLQGWQSVPPYLPTVESSVVPRGSADAALFNTPTNNPAVSSPCLTEGTGCGILNISTIYQTVDNVSVSAGTRFSMAVEQAFQSPSAFQVSLAFGLTHAAAGRAGYDNVLVIYVVKATAQECSSYAQYLVDISPAGTITATHCISVQQGAWTYVDRAVASDLPSGITASELGGSILTASISFAGAGPTDEVYAGSFSLT